MIYHKRQGLLNFFENSCLMFENLKIYTFGAYLSRDRSSNIIPGIVTPSATRSLFDPVLNDCPLYGPLLSYDSEDEDSESVESDWINSPRADCYRKLLAPGILALKESSENCQNWLVASTACFSLGKTVGKWTTCCSEQRVLWWLSFLVLPKWWSPFHWWKSDVQNTCIYIYIQLYTVIILVYISSSITSDWEDV